MATRADELIDRRRLRRKLTFWRAAALAFIALAIIGAATYLYRDEFGGAAVPHIAKVKIEGTILEDEELLERLEDIRKSAAVRGVILSIDSPGGTSAGGEAIFDAVRKLAAEKPVTAQVGTLAASAGYMIASATDHIVARQSSIVGSIGVIMQFPNVTGLLDKIGVNVETVKSAPFKAEPSPFNPTTEEERAMLQALVRDSYEWFIGLVDARRPLNRAEVQRLADGSIFTGRQALAAKLIDELGGEDAAKAWLVSKGVSKDLEIVEWKARNRGGFWFGSSAESRLVRALGLPEQTSDLLRRIGADRIFLDGLLSLWQPDAAALRD
jgi:protease IV